MILVNKKSINTHTHTQRNPPTCGPVLPLHTPPGPAGSPLDTPPLPSPALPAASMSPWQPTPHPLLPGTGGKDCNQGGGTLSHKCAGGQRGGGAECPSPCGTSGGCCRRRLPHSVPGWCPDTAAASARLVTGGGTLRCTLLPCMADTHTNIRMTNIHEQSVFNIT